MFSDYDFWARCMHTTRFANVNEVLLNIVSMKPILTGV